MHNSTLARPCPNVSAEGLHFSAFHFNCRTHIGKCASRDIIILHMMIGASVSKSTPCTLAAMH